MMKEFQEQLQILEQGAADGLRYIGQGSGIFEHSRMAYRCGFFLEQAAKRAIALIKLRSLLVESLNDSFDGSSIKNRARLEAMVDVVDEVLGA